MGEFDSNEKTDPDSARERSDRINFDDGQFQTMEMIGQAKRQNCLSEVKDNFAGVGMKKSSYQAVGTYLTR